MIKLHEELDKVFKKCIDFKINITSTRHAVDRKKRSNFLYIRNGEIKSILARGTGIVISSAIKNFIYTGNKQKLFIIRDRRNVIDLVLSTEFVLKDNFPSLNITIVTIGPKGQELRNKQNTKILDLTL